MAHCSGSLAIFAAIRRATSLLEFSRHLTEEQVAPSPLHDEAVPMREYDEDDYNIRRHAPVLRRVIILVAVIIAVPVMMWTITIFVRSYVEHPKTFRHLTLTESLPPKPQAAQLAPAPLLTDAARKAGDGLASLPDPNSGSLKGPLALPPGDAPPAVASPTGPAETAPNAPTAASGEAAAVTDSAQSAATAEIAASEAVSPEAIRGGIPLQRDRPTATEPATGSMAWIGPIPLPRVRPVDAPVDTPPVPSSSLSGSSLFAPAPYGGPGADSAH
jgi:hypothetical protein